MKMTFYKARGDRFFLFITGYPTGISIRGGKDNWGFGYFGFTWTKDEIKRVFAAKQVTTKQVPLQIRNMVIKAITKQCLSAA